MSSPAEESFYRMARALARGQAERWRLGGDLADELEQSFVVGWALRPKEPPIWTWPRERLEPFLWRAARNHAINFMKRLRIEREAAAKLVASLTEGNRDTVEGASGQPEARCFRRLFWQEIRSGMLRLRPDTGNLLAEYLRGATPVELGAACGRSSRAVSQSLLTARRRLKVLLARRGSTEGELRSYFPLIQPTLAPCGNVNCEE